MTRIDRHFSSEDLVAIEAAVKRAEAVTSGEIVTYLAGSSDTYHLAAWKGAAFGAVLVSLVAAVGYGAVAAWDLWVEALLAMPAVLGGAVGYLCGRLVTPIRRALIDNEVMEERVSRRAAEVFLAEEVFRTRDRSGILIYLSVFERRVVVLADSGIRAAVPQNAWDEVANDLVAAMRRGAAAQGTIEAVEACAAILSTHRLSPSSDDVNELSDVPRIEADT